MVLIFLASYQGGRPDTTLFPLPLEQRRQWARSSRSWTGSWQGWRSASPPPMCPSWTWRAASRSPPATRTSRLPWRLPRMDPWMVSWWDFFNPFELFLGLCMETGLQKERITSVLPCNVLCGFLTLVVLDFGLYRIMYTKRCFGHKKILRFRNGYFV